jgi:hypothetical protein
MQFASNIIPSGMVSIIGVDLDQIHRISEEVYRRSGRSIVIANYLARGIGLSIDLFVY